MKDINIKKYLYGILKRIANKIEGYKIFFGSLKLEETKKAVYV